MKTPINHKEIAERISNAAKSLALDLKTRPNEIILGTGRLSDGNIPVCSLGHVFDRARLWEFDLEEEFDPDDLLEEELGFSVPEKVQTLLNDIMSTNDTDPSTNAFISGGEVSLERKEALVPLLEKFADEAKHLIADPFMAVNE